MPVPRAGMAVALSRTGGPSGARRRLSEMQANLWREVSSRERRAKRSIVDI